MATAMEIVLGTEEMLRDGSFVPFTNPAERITEAEFTMTKGTLTKTNSSRNGVAVIEGDQDIAFETAAVFAVPTPSKRAIKKKSAHAQKSDKHRLKRLLRQMVRNEVSILLNEVKNGYAPTPLRGRLIE